MQFIHPLTTYAFTKIFGSAESADISLSFLNAVLGFAAPYRLQQVSIQDQRSMLQKAKSPIHLVSPLPASILIS